MTLLNTGIVIVTKKSRHERLRGLEVWETGSHYKPENQEWSLPEDYAAEK